MRALRILHLYPDRMSIYGDIGNIICLQKRMEWHGLKYEYITNTVGEKLQGKFDLIFMGGGQDRGQIAVGKDLQGKNVHIRDHIESGVPALTICGGYQLFGKYFLTKDSGEIAGISIFDVVTKATELRMIGNVVCVSDEFGTIVGFENHSGATSLGKNAQPLARVIQGCGNDRESGFEGTIYKSAIGTYLHGPLLPKNPSLADFLISQAARKVDINFRLNKIDDSLAEQANVFAQKLPR